MRPTALLAIPAIGLTLSCQADSASFAPEHIIAMERAALDRWGRGDPQGYLTTMAPEVTYFDPIQARRIDGLGAMKDLLVPLTGKIRVDRYDMLDPKVQFHGDSALLTFNLVSYQKQADGADRVVARWNSSELYARVDGRWQIVHSHWSYIQPELKKPVSEGS
jgi:ketosteroid isomerase-like protein